MSVEAVNKDVKTLLAKLLATEDITVELAHESMYFMVLDMIDEKEQRDYSQRWERVL